MNLDTIGREILERLEAKNARREKVLAVSRHLVQHAARAIHAILREDWGAVDGILAEADRLNEEMNTAAAGEPDLMAAGYTLDAQKEYAEAHLTRALVSGGDLPPPEALGVADPAWLNGLGEAVGELRRRALDLIRRGRIEDAEDVLDQMSEAYVFLSTVDFPRALTRDLKRTNDMVRGVTERTRGDLTIAVRQEQLKAALDRFEARVTAAGGHADLGSGEAQPRVP
jgi:translin